MTEINNTNTEASDVEMKMPTSNPQVQSTPIHTGPMIGVLLIMFVLILAGLYLWGGMLKSNNSLPNEPVPIVNNEPETTRAIADQKIAETLSTSDELSAIEADVNTTDLNSIDTELTAVETEFNGASTVQ